MADLNKAVNALCDETSGDMQLNFMALRARLYGDKSDEALAFAAEFIKHKPSSELAISGLQYGRMMVSFRIPDDEIVAHARTWKTVAPADMKGLFLALELWIHFDNEEYEVPLQQGPATKIRATVPHVGRAQLHLLRHVRRGLRGRA
ncbi:MAG: hypothetical protein U5N86_05765 [Planctomycetota bacterium]|nr:hypothetical protein [Planctomycetota bacterium]